jgi:hypothetical protein
MPSLRNTQSPSPGEVAFYFHLIIVTFSLYITGDIFKREVLVTVILFSLLVRILAKANFSRSSIVRLADDQTATLHGKKESTNSAVKKEVNLFCFVFLF